MIRQTVAAISLGLFLPLCVASQPAPEQRRLRPEDLFRVRQVGATAWSADGRVATIELSRPGRWLDTSLPSSEIALLDVKTSTLRTISSNATRCLGFFSSYGHRMGAGWRFSRSMRAQRYKHGFGPSAVARFSPFCGEPESPWVKTNLYLAGSPIFHADKVQTPLMLIHGDIDNIPIQQDEEFFTALYRQDKRARLVRYHGEWHTISNRANVLDLWKRIADWLSETMAVRNQG